MNKMSRNDNMTKRERVEAAMNFQEVDRIPVYDILLNDDVIEYFTGRVPPIGDEGARLQCQAISKMLDMTRMAGIGPAEEGELTSEDGFVHYRYRWQSGGIRKRPFNNVEGAVEWLKKINGNMEKAVRNFDPGKAKAAFLEKFNMIKKYIGDDTVVIHRESGTGLDWIRNLLGLELFSYMSVDEPEHISEYLELYTEQEVKTIHAIADRKLSPCALTFGDIAFKGHLMHSPQWLGKEFLPRLKRLNETWHEYGVRCLFHSDGNVMEILQDLIETGIDGLNPIETTAGMSIKETREKAGNRIFLAGGIDISTLMSFGKPEEVREECIRAISDAGRGYLMGSTTELDPGSKLENVLAMLEVARRKTP